MQITKAEMASLYEAKYPEKTMVQATEEVDFIYDSIFDGLKSGKKVFIDNVGTLTVEDTKARNGRNPRTGEALVIPAGKKVKFRISSTLKTALKELLK